MKKPVWLVVLLVACAAFPLFLLTRRQLPAQSLSNISRQAHVQSTERKTLQVTGEVLDIACYLDNNLHGTEHKKCASACLKDGQPIGLLDDRGGVFLLIEDHTAKTAYLTLKGYAAERVQLTGEHISRGGVQSLLVKEVHKVSRGGSRPAESSTDPS